MLSTLNHFETVIAFAWAHAKSFSLQMNHILRFFLTYKPMINCKELCAPENPPVLKDPPSIADKDVVNLLSYISSNVILSPAVQLWSYQEPVK